MPAIYSQGLAQVIVALALNQIAMAFDIISVSRYNVLEMIEMRFEQLKHTALKIAIDNFG
jgi:hypothetical protein